MKEYNKYVKSVTPTTNTFLNVCRAFVMGGIICTVGQAFANYYKYLGYGEKKTASLVSLTLILISVILTGLNIYPKLAKFGGAGTLVPITGFANSVAAPAIEFKKEGQVFGIGCKIFTIAGPVILFGIFFSWLVGVFYYAFTVWGWI